MKKLITIAISIALLGACAPRVPPPRQVQAPQQTSQVQKQAKPKAQDKHPTWHKIKGPLLLGLDLAELGAYIFLLVSRCPSTPSPPSKINPLATP